MSLKPKGFEILLVLENFRSVAYYLSIIKTLSPKYKIGIYKLPLDSSSENKTGGAQAYFEELCQQLGAELVDGCPEVSCRICLVPQRPYKDESLMILKTKIKSEKTVGALSFAWAGLHDKFIQELEIGELFVMDRKFCDFLLADRGVGVYQNRKMTEVGIPFGRYPVAGDFRADYLIAMPTPFSFPHETDKWSFLKTVLKLYQKLSPQDIVVHKTHNGMENDGFSSEKLKPLAKILSAIPGIEEALIEFSKLLPRKLRLSIGKLVTAVLYHRVKMRSVSIEKLTPMKDIAVEMFFAHVKKGVIGGLSNTIWGSLYFKLPFYNCVDMSIQRRDDLTERTYGSKDPARLLETNLKYFYVPFCEGELRFDSKYFDIVSESTRKGDIVRELETRLQTLSSTQKSSENSMGRT